MSDLQTSAFRADQPLTAADALFMAEQTQDFVAKRVSPVQKDVQHLRDTVRLLTDAVANQFKELLELIRLVASQPGRVDKDVLAAATKELFFQHEATMLRAFAALAQQMDAIEKSALMEWKGPWRADEHYYKGDVTQRDGRTHIALVDNKGETPGKSSAWRSFAISKESP